MPCPYSRLGPSSFSLLLALITLTGACMPQGSEDDDADEASDADETANGSESGGDPSAGVEIQGDPIYVKASNTDSEDAFGIALSLSASGSLLAVGAGKEASAATGVGGDANDDSAPQAGAVYVFAETGGAWQQEAYVKASNAGEGDGFGGVLAISADGATLAVAAPFEASAATGVGGDQADDSQPSAGAVYVFVRQGGAWVQEAYLKASNTERSDRFGIALGLSGDGNVLAIGAEGEDNSAGASHGLDDEAKADSGAVYVFSRGAAGWQQDAYLKASNADAVDRFGGAIAISGDGTTLAVGATGEDSIATGVDGDPTSNASKGSGAVYVFVRDATAWWPQTYLKPARVDPDGYDGFGTAVSISADGNTLAVGAAGDASGFAGVDADPDDHSAPYAGAAYVFVREGASWRHDTYLKAEHPGEGDEFGHHIHLSLGGDVLVVGAALEDSGATGIDGDPEDGSADGAGAAYLFTRDGMTWRPIAFVKAPNTRSGARFGWSVGLSDTRMAIGAIDEGSAATGLGGDLSDTSAPRAGAAYLYPGVFADVP